MTTRSDRAWRVPAGAGLCVEPLGSGCVVFHAATGSTHFLQEPAGAGLRALLEGAYTAAQVRERIADTFAIPESADLTAYVDDLLNRLARLGLVE